MEDDNVHFMEAANRVVQLATENPHPLDQMEQNVYWLVNGLALALQDDRTRNGYINYDHPDFQQYHGNWIRHTRLNEYLFGGHSSRDQLLAVERIMFIAAENANA